MERHEKVGIIECEIKNKEIMAETLVSGNGKKVNFKLEELKKIATEKNIIFKKNATKANMLEILTGQLD